MDSFHSLYHEQPSQLAGRLGRMIRDVNVDRRQRVLLLAVTVVVGRRYSQFALEKGEGMPVAAPEVGELVRVCGQYWVENNIWRVGDRVG
jgi:hypothetical protein